MIIYYNDPTITDHVVKQLVEKVAKEGGTNKQNKHTDQDKSKASKLVPSSGLNSQQTTATNGHNNTSGEPVTIFYGASGLATSQVEQEKKEEMIIKEPIEPKLVEFKPSSSSDPNDVITGGAPISPPSLPASNQDGQLLRLRCTLVSHPGHFYIRFHNEKHDQLLASLDEFYNNDELIELTVDVLRTGQYYGACRIRPGRREWVRAQLLHVESAEMINCLLIDEGCFGVFRLADLQPLYSSFRTVPKQAIRAEIKGFNLRETCLDLFLIMLSLAGIKPPESATDWLPKQAVEFKSLVSDRPLFTRLDDDHHALVECGHRLRLDLMFGKDDQDETLRGRSVASLLIERGLAQEEESV